MKAILKSIRPRHTGNILNGNKIIEISTTAPKEWVDYLSGKTNKKPKPRDVYIYCTKAKLKDQNWLIDKDNKGDLQSPYGKVVAKFTLNKVEEIKYCEVPFTHEQWFMEYWTKTFSDMEDLLKASCLDYYSLDQYLDNACKRGYAWHIDNLVIFDKPKELYEYKTLHHFGIDNKCKMLVPLTKAPQSWCYVEV